MSKYDSDLRAVAEVTGELEELLAALGQRAGSGSGRHDAMAQFLSGQEGWRDARRKLRGAFARPAPGDGPPVVGMKK